MYWHGTSDIAAASIAHEVHLRQATAFTSRSGEQMLPKLLLLANSSLCCDTTAHQGGPCSF